MNFNYAREKRRFNKEWERLQEEYAAAGMDDTAIARMKEFDWQWFCSRRTYARHNQPLPDDGNIPEDRTVLFRKFPKLSVELGQQALPDPYSWIQEIEDEELYERLCSLKKEEKELLYLIVAEGYTQAEVARLWGCSRSAISQRMKKIRNSLKST